MKIICVYRIVTKCNIVKYSFGRILRFKQERVPDGTGWDITRRKRILGVYGQCPTCGNRVSKYKWSVSLQIHLKERSKAETTPEE